MREVAEGVVRASVFESASAVGAHPASDSTALGGSAAQTMVSTRRRGRSRQFVPSIEWADARGPLAHPNDTCEVPATSSAPLLAAEHDSVPMDYAESARDTVTDDVDGTPIAQNDSPSDEAAHEHALPPAPAEGSAASSDYDLDAVVSRLSAIEGRKNEHARPPAPAEGSAASSDYDLVAVVSRLSAIEGRMNELVASRSRGEATIIASQRSMARQLEQFQTNLAATLRGVHAAVLERPIGVAPGTPSLSVPLPPPPTPHTNASILTAQQQARAEASRVAAQSRFLSRQPASSRALSGSSETAMDAASAAPKAPDATGSETNRSTNGATSFEQQARSRLNHDTAKRRLEERRAALAAIPPATMDALRQLQDHDSPSTSQVPSSFLPAAVLSNPSSQRPYKAPRTHAPAEGWLAPTRR